MIRRALRKVRLKRFTFTQSSPGGVTSAEELVTALKLDKIAARHYSNFRADKAVLTYGAFRP